MADANDTKTEAVAEKAMAAAGDAVTTSSSDTSAAVKAAADKPAPAKIDAAISSAKTAAPAKRAVNKQASRKTATKQSAAKAPRKAALARKTAAAVKAPRVAKLKIAAKAAPVTQLKDKIMATTKNQTEDFSAKMKDAAGDIQSRAKAAFEKSSAFASDYTEFNKSNVEAVVASTKILAAGVQDMGRTYVAEAKTAFETITADVKEIAAVKSPTELFQLQSKLMRRNFDSMVAYGSKNTEAMVKLVNEAMVPISGRVSLAVEKVRKAA